MKLSIGPLSTAETFNWAGYVAKGHTFTMVRGSWVVPKTSCTQPNSVAAFWVGMDGYTNSYVEQAGTLAMCRSGHLSYATWWEMYPTTQVQLVGRSVKPGDHITASVTASGHTFTLKVVDHTTKGNTFTKRTSCVRCHKSSAEWIAERTRSPNGLYPLARFGQVHFSSSRVGVGQTTGSISKFTHDAVTMINHKSEDLARVSALQQAGNRFDATWVRDS